MVDPGDEAEVIITEIEKSEKMLKYILLTHGHFDHVMAVNEIVEKYPGLEVFIHEKDIVLLDELREQGIFVHKIIHKFNSEVLAFKEGDEIKLGDELIKVIETPGHTLGSVSFLVDNDLFSGDTLFYHTYGRVDLPYSDSHLMMHSLDKLFKLDPEFKVYPGHGRETTIGEERKFSVHYL